MRPIRLGCIGLGWWGDVLTRAAGRTPDAEVVACFARTPETRRAFAAEHACWPAPSLDALLASDDIDAVLIATTHTSHADLIVAAAEAGKHVLVDKPLALEVAEAERAIEAAERAGVVLSVGHQRRRQRTNREIKALLDDGLLGTPLVAEASFTTADGILAPWRADPNESPLGGMTALGVHMVDTYHYLLGPIRRVVAISNPVLADTPLEHATALAVELTSGATGTVVVTQFAVATNRVAVFGDEGAAFGEDDGHRLFVQRKGEAARTEVPIEPIDPVVDQIDELAACIRGEATPEVGGGEGLAVVEVLDAARRSATTGRVEEVAVRP